MVITLRRVLIACGVLVALAAGVVVLAHILRPGVVASTKGQSILSRALLATEKEPFEAGAVVVTSYGGRTLRSTAHIVHAANGTVTTEYLDGPIAGTKVVSNGSGMTWLGPNLAKATYQATPSIDAAERLRLIGSSYSPTCLGSDTVAGRDCYVIEIRTRRGNRPVQRISSDAETGVILRRATLDEQGRDISSTTFTQVSFHVPEAGGGRSAVDNAHPTKVFEPLDDLAYASKLGFAPRDPGYVPQGFVKAGSCVYHCQCGCGMDSYALHYTDGIRAFTVFETPRTHAGCAAGICPHHENAHACAMSTYGNGNLGARIVGPMAVVAVGDLQPEELKRVVTSVTEP